MLRVARGLHGPRLLIQGARGLPGVVQEARRGLALKPWPRPSMSELSVPTEPWEKVHKKNQRKFSLHLVVGVVAYGFTIYTIYNNVLYNGTPEFVRDTGFVTKDVPQEILVALVGQTKTYTGLEGIKDVRVEVNLFEEVVAEAEEVVKNALKGSVEEADEIIVKVKEIEDEVKEIIEDTSKLAKDVKEVIVEGVEIVQEIKEAADVVLNEVIEVLDKRKDHEDKREEKTDA